MKEKDLSLLEHMKEYERGYRIFLDESLTTIIRLDGRSFHTFTRGFFYNKTLKDAFK